MHPALRNFLQDVATFDPETFEMFFAPRSRLPNTPVVVNHDKAAVAAAQQRLQAYLQQQDGISPADAERLARRFCVKLGADADQQAAAPLEWCVSRGMQPVKAALLLAHMCDRSNHAVTVQQWAEWQPLLEANWQLADSHLAAYQQQRRENKQRLLKDSESVAALLSSKPSMYPLLRVRDLPQKVALLQQHQLDDADVGRIMASTSALTVSLGSLARAVQWLVGFAGSSEAAAGMLRATPQLLEDQASGLPSRLVRLQGAWHGALQPEQLQQLVCRWSAVLTIWSPDYYQTAAVLRDWFPRPSTLYTVLQAAPQLLAAPGATLLANSRCLMAPPFSLSRQQFLALFKASPHILASNISTPLTKHKLTFMTQVGCVVLWFNVYLTTLKQAARTACGMGWPAGGRCSCLTQPLHLHASFDAIYPLNCSPF